VGEELGELTLELSVGRAFCKPHERGGEQLYFCIGTTGGILQASVCQWRLGMLCSEGTFLLMLVFLIFPDNIVLGIL